MPRARLPRSSLPACLRGQGETRQKGKITKQVHRQIRFARHNGATVPNRAPFAPSPPGAYGPWGRGQG